MTVGLLLKQARESSGLSVDEVAALTRIRPQVILDLEAGNLVSSGGIAYARGHIRSIAKVINADPEVLVAQFNQEADLSSRSMSELLADNSATTRHSDSPNISYKKLSIAGIVLIALLIIIPAVSSFFHSTPKISKPTPQPSATAHAVTTPSPASTSAAPVASATPAATPSDAPSASPATTPSVSASVVPASTVSFKAVNANSWFSVTDSSGTVLWHGTLYKGATESFNVTALIDVTIGNAGAVDVTINGKDAGVSGTIGQVVHIQYGPGAKS
jgi:cytoskeletal protein RodZ